MGKRSLFGLDLTLNSRPTLFGGFLGDTASSGDVPLSEDERRWLYDALRYRTVEDELRKYREQNGADSMLSRYKAALAAAADAPSAGYPEGLRREDMEKARDKDLGLTMALQLSEGLKSAFNPTAGLPKAVPLQTTNADRFKEDRSFYEKEQAAKTADEGRRLAALGEGAGLERQDYLDAQTAAQRDEDRRRRGVEDLMKGVQAFSHLPAVADRYVEFQREANRYIHDPTPERLDSLNAQVRDMQAIAKGEELDKENRAQDRELAKEDRGFARQGTLQRYGAELSRAEKEGAPLPRPPSSTMPVRPPPGAAGNPGFEQAMRGRPPLNARPQVQPGANMPPPAPSPEEIRRRTHLPDDVRKHLDDLDQQIPALEQGVRAVESTPSAFGRAADLSQYWKGGAGGGAALGAAVGSIVPGVGTAVGAGIGAVAGGLLGAGGAEAAGAIQRGARSPEETEARRAVFAQAYETIKRLAGTAMSEAEKSRIEQFLPAPNDTAESVRVKVAGALREAAQQRERLRSTYGLPPAGPPPGPGRFGGYGGGRSGGASGSW